MVINTSSKLTETSLTLYLPLYNQKQMFTKTVTKINFEHSHTKHKGHFKEFQASITIISEQIEDFLCIQQKRYPKHVDLISDKVLVEVLAGIENKREYDIYFFFRVAGYVFSLIKDFEG